MMQVFVDGKHVGNVQMNPCDFWAGRLASGTESIPLSDGPFRWTATFKARIKKSDLRFLRRLSGSSHGRRARRASFYSRRRNARHGRGNLVFFGEVPRKAVVELP